MAKNIAQNDNQMNVLLLFERRDYLWVLVGIRGMILKVNHTG
jgi:hypothetical protein